ncbi:Abi family protein [Paenibacillus sp. J2TS4]|uniref:Abi family protein n=1 Tax=Paenibacillus sp. J2TS4 TaxID=2807194 RepID=UPI001B241CA2|nr:Abi family protein [Paenibacillus sp. J2TS4]GIP35914.1 hypothetical protein J2TS4_51240 [Paenibacillus sp. J2TS4]
MPTDKEFNLITNQIRLLKDRGLIFNNLDTARKHLMEKNYFNLINGFETLLLDDSKNSPKQYTKKSFDNFLRLHDFDRQLSSLIFQKISEFETKLKTSIAYHFCKNHCSTLAENNNYIDCTYYNVPRRTDGPKQYVNFFYNQSNPGKTHKLLRKDYKYSGRFKGKFIGDVTYSNDKTTLKGIFSGRFGSTSIREVRDGTYTFKNSKQAVLLASLHGISRTSGSTISLPIDISNINILGLDYIDECKIKFPYVDAYNNPPFWVVIKTLMLNDVIILMYGLKKRTLDAVLRDFNLKPNDKEKFLNTLEIIKELRNTCAHFELISRFRTPKNLKINARLISELKLTPIRSQYIIKLYDVLKVLKCFADLRDIKALIWSFWNNEIKYGSGNIARSFLERMGNENVEEWI